jgi:hypothetical protein
MAMTIAMSGCVITSSPDFNAPQMTRPYLTAIAPPPWEVKTIKSTGTLTFPQSSVTFGVVSEDLNRSLLGLMVLDYQGPAAALHETPPIIAQPMSIDAGHLDSVSAVTPRTVDMPFQIGPGTSLGCHSLTVIVTHDLQPTKVVPKEEDDSATLTWWVNLEDPLSSSPVNIATCLTTSSTGDAGTTGVTQ